MAVSFFIAITINIPHIFVFEKISNNIVYSQFNVRVIMFKRIKTGMIIVLTGLMISSSPVRASDGESTEDPVEISTEMTAETGTETDAATYANGETIKVEPLSTFDGSIQVVYGVLFEDESFDAWATASGVLVNQNTVICNDISKNDFTDTIRDREPGYAALGMNTSSVELQFRIYDGRELISVTDAMHDSVELSDGINEILILKTAEEIKNPDGSDKVIHLSPGGEINDNELFVTGYTEISPNQYFTQDDLLIQTLRVTDTNNAFYSFSSNAQFITDGSAVINSYNEICGFIWRNGTAINIEVIKQILDRNGIFFETAEPAYMIDRTGLSKLLETLPETDEEGKYTEESWNSYSTKRESAVNVLGEKITTQDKIDAALEELQASYVQLEEAPMKIDYVLITVISLIVIFLLFGVYVFIRWKKDHNYIYKLLGIHKKTVPDTNKGTVVASGIFEDTPIPDVDELPAPQSEYKPSYAVNTDSNADIKIEKTEKNEQQRKTFSGSLKKEGPVILIRDDTNERIDLSKNYFVVGRLKTCDYSISNDAVSKEHCRFISLDGIYHVVDVSTNGTYVNGSLIPKNTPTIIKSHDKIAISNIIFEFINKNEAEQSSYQDFEHPDMQQEAFDDVYEASTGVLTETKTNAGLIWRGIRYNISTSPFSVGRSKYANLQISNDINVSREHIIITEESGGYYSIYDNDATNDTVLNGYVIEPMKKYILEDGATIQILNEVLTFSKQGGQ